MKLTLILDDEKGHKITKVLKARRKSFVDGNLYTLVEEMVDILEESKKNL